MSLHRPEFKLLDLDCQQLQLDLEINQEFLLKVRDRIRHCDFIAKTPEERACVTRIIFWWRKIAGRFGLDMNPIGMNSEPKLITVSCTKSYEFTEDDLEYLSWIARGPKP